MGLLKCSVAISIFLYLFTVQFTYSQEHYDLNHNRLNGKVKSVTMTMYSGVEKFGEIEKGGFRMKKSLKYDESGKEIECIYYKENGQVDDWSTYNYDTNGLTKEWIRYDANNVVTSRFEYIYNDKSIRTEYNEYDSKNNLVAKCKYKYDNNGNKIEQNVYNGDGSLDLKTTYKYDSNNRMIERKLHYGGNSDLRITFIYNKLNQISTEIAYQGEGEGKLYWKYTFKYDSKGSMIEEKHYDADNTVSSTTVSTTDKSISEYDDKGNTIKETTYTDGVINALIFYAIEYY